jgi:hypothetical protein
MVTTTYKPRERFELNNIVPTETEKHFRMQQMRGDVHDEGAAMFGGVAGMQDCLAMLTIWHNCIKCY